MHGFARIIRAAAISSDAHYLRICISRVYSHIRAGRVHAWMGVGIAFECLYKELQSASDFPCSFTLIAGTENYTYMLSACGFKIAAGIDIPPWFDIVDTARYSVYTYNILDW